ncbi:MAG TPA: hypothetical protein VKF38_10720 [Anaerolineaceae bacterium]|nr:hypothetical protein [Anaerolineaceae bacterium]
MDLKGHVRPLYVWEKLEAHKIFADRLDYERVRIHEAISLPDTIDLFSRKLRGMPALDQGRHNAITIGNHCFFPLFLPQELPYPTDPADYAIGWLIHELTHAWQFQQTGWRYFFQAIWVQLRQKSRVYDLPDPDSLIQLRRDGWTFFNFSVEQQGDLTRRYYYVQRNPNRTTIEFVAYAPYIQDLIDSARSQK